MLQVCVVIDAMQQEILLELDNHPFNTQQRIVFVIHWSTFHIIRHKEFFFLLKMSGLRFTQSAVGNG